MKKTVLTAPIAALLLLSCAEAPQEKGKEITYTPQAAYNPPTYVCYKAPAPIKIDGKLSPEEWDAIPWTTDFVDIEGDKRPKPLLQTRAKMTYDDNGMYFAVLMEEPHVWGTITEHDAVIYQDNDFEIFIDPDSDTQQYYEFEMNVLNTVWDLFLPAAYRDGGNAVNGYDIHGLRTAVAVKGSINRPDGKNTGWSAEVVIPFRAITECLPGKRAPKAGEYFRMNFSRVQWTVDKEDGCYRKRTDPVTGNPLPEDNWVWAPTGVINIHYPELWGFVFFTDGQEEVGRAGSIPEDERRKWELRKLYYAQQLYRDENGRYTDDFTALTEILHRHAALPENGRVLPLAYKISV